MTTQLEYAAERWLNARAVGPVPAAVASNLDRLQDEAATACAAAVCGRGHRAMRKTRKASAAHAHLHRSAVS